MLTTWSWAMLMGVLWAGERAVPRAGTARRGGRALIGREGYHCPPPAAYRRARVTRIDMRHVYPGLLAAALAAGGYAPAAPAPQPARASAMADNPFAKPSTLPFQLPPFDRSRDSDYLPAFEAGMHQQLEEVARIADSKEPATFENTIVALERSGQLL